MLKEWHLDISKSKAFQSKLILEETGYFNEGILKIKVACDLTENFESSTVPWSEFSYRQLVIVYDWCIPGLYKVQNFDVLNTFAIIVSPWITPRNLLGKAHTKQLPS